MPYEHVLELALELALVIAKGQPPDVSAELWRRALAILEKMDANGEAFKAFIEKLIVVMPTHAKDAKP
jgi:hypothetical protein